MCVLCECVWVCAYVMVCMYVVLKGQSRATVLKPSTLFEIRSSFSAHCSIHQDSWPTASVSFQYRSAGITDWVTTFSFYMGIGDPNVGPNALPQNHILGPKIN